MLIKLVIYFETPEPKFVGKRSLGPMLEFVDAHEIQLKS